MTKLSSIEFKAARLAMGMTQKQMAEWLYTSDRRIRAWERGEAAIPGGVRRCIEQWKIINSLRKLI